MSTITQPPPPRLRWSQALHSAGNGQPRLVDLDHRPGDPDAYLATVIAEPSATPWDPRSVRAESVLSRIDVLNGQIIDSLRLEHTDVWWPASPSFPEFSSRMLFQVATLRVGADGEVVIVDEFTGRVMPDRSWERGLHQMIEVKEGCEITGQRETLARISYQRFFRRYVRLSGMTRGQADAPLVFYCFNAECWMSYNAALRARDRSAPERMIERFLESIGGFCPTFGLDRKSVV